MATFSFLRRPVKLVLYGLLLVFCVTTAVLGLLPKPAHTQQKTIIVVTHDTFIARHCDLRMRLKNGLPEPMD